MKLKDWLQESVIVPAGPSQGPVAASRTFTRVIGTSGSTDYLRPGRGDERRFWPVAINRDAVTAGETSEETE